MPDGGALAGTLVVELGGMVSGPFCTRLLADYGATVIKLEPPGGDPLRELGAADEAGAWFDGLNTNKLSVVADLDTDDGRAVARAIVERADVVVESLAPGELDRRLDLTRPRLVVTSISPFGRTGPRSGCRGGDLTAAAAGGLAFITGDEDREPLVPGGHQIEHLAGLEAMAATLIALFHARRTGEGQRIDVSLQEVAAGTLECTVSTYEMTRAVRGRMGTRHPAVHGVGMQRLADGRWLFVGTLPQQRMWDTVKALMGDPEWARDGRWDDPHLRRRQADEVDALAAPVFARLATDEIYPAMKSGRVPVGLVRDIADLHSPAGQLAARGYFTTLQDGDDRRAYPGPPWRMAPPWALRTRAPRLGEHDDEISELLGPATRRGEATIGR